MSQANPVFPNAQLLELAEKLLAISNLQADAALKKAQANTGRAPSLSTADLTRMHQWFVAIRDLGPLTLVAADFELANRVEALLARRGTGAAHRPGHAR